MSHLHILLADRDGLEFLLNEYKQNATGPPWPPYGRMGKIGVGHQLRHQHCMPHLWFHVCLDAMPPRRDEVLTVRHQECASQAVVVQDRA